MKLTKRPYQTEEDYWRIRSFLRRVMRLNGLREKSWHVARLDYWRWHVAANCQDRHSLADLVFLWETADGEIAAVLNPEGEGDAHLQVHPELRTPELEEEAAPEELAPAAAEAAATRDEPVVAATREEVLYGTPSFGQRLKNRLCNAPVWIQTLAEYGGITGRYIYCFNVLTVLTFVIMIGISDL